MYAIDSAVNDAIYIYRLNESPLAEPIHPASLRSANGSERDRLSRGQLHAPTAPRSVLNVLCNFPIMSGYILAFHYDYSFAH